MTSNVSLIGKQDPRSLQDPVQFDRFFSKQDIEQIDRSFTRPRETVPLCQPGKSCENNLFLGFFFDGTRNNYALSEESGTHTHSNVARLYDAFPGLRIAPARVLKASPQWPNEAAFNNYLRIYTPGVGTPFDEIKDSGEHLDATMGAATARWGERRLVWALCQAINAVHLYLTKDTFIKPQRVLQLADLITLDGEQLRHQPNRWKILFYGPRAKDFLQRLLESWHQAIRAHMPEAVTKTRPKIDPGVIKHIYVSAFGFSRGATAARAYTNWLLALCELDAELTGQVGYTLGGFPVTFDFLGLFDTVASVGTAGIAPNIIGTGHNGWADPERSLRVPSSVKCLHIVSAHEVRRCFPLDAISVRGAMAANHKEIIMPGVHSDIGGGYAPGEQGRGLDPQGADMLSRVALALMYREARLSGAPLKLEKAAPVSRQRFAVHPDVIRALNAYIDACSVRTGNFRDIMRDQMKWSILWRKHWAGRMGSSASVQRAAQVDRNDIVSADQEFVDEIAAFQSWVKEPATTKQVTVCPKPEMGICMDMEETVSNLPGVDPERLPEWKDIAAFWNEGPVPAAIAHLLENFVHDSRAWFKLMPGSIEAGDVERELKQWVKLYDNYIAIQKNPVALGLAGGYVPKPLNDTKIEWVKLYKQTGKIPSMKTTGREPFELGAGYLRFRRVYSGASHWRLTQLNPVEPIGELARATG
ncbi:MAG: T6SS phospholipase effector Tle1-like catalytic domain-containing protein [Aquabacterium sp.]